jgi:hypothetical protein
MSRDRIAVHRGPDERGRYVYTRFWIADYHPGHPDGEYRRAERGQVFHAAMPRRSGRREEPTR